MKLILSSKSILAKLISSVGIPGAMIRNRSGKQYLILMYHRILPSDQVKPWVQAGMYVHPDTFEMHILVLKQYFQVVSLFEKFSTIQAAKNSESIRPACILTFDDGWRDFYDFAYPVLKRNQIPATVFLPTGYVGTNDWFWTDRLAWLLTNALPPARLDKPGNPILEKIAGIKGAYEERLEAAIYLLKNRNNQEIEEAIAALIERVGIGATPNQRVFLNWEEVREMRESGLVTFGSHTHNHRILVHLKEGEVREELVLSKKTLLREGVVDPSFIPFCYPNGNWNERIVCMVQEAGYHAAVSTGKGWNDGDASPFELRRVAIHQDMSASREMFGCRVVDIL